MNSFVVILSLSCLAAVTFASPTQDIVVEFMANGRARCRNASCGRNGIVGAACPPTNCPPRQPPASCGTEPDCNIVANRAWHHVHWDPNFFWQCAPYQGENDWRPIAMPCACGTLFVTARNRCQHPHEWAPECPGQVNPPVLAPCDEDCGPVCDGDGGNGGNPTAAPPTTATTTQSPPLTTPPSPATDDNVDTPATPSPPGNGDCPCICIPCIFWPCSPCTASRSGCPCSQNQQQRPQPQPLPEPPRNNPWAPPRQPPTQWVPEAPRQPPTQWVPEQPRQPEWQPPRIPEQPRQPEWQPPRIPQQPPTNWQPQPPQQWQPQPPQQWQPQPPQNNPWQRPFAAEDEEEQLVAEKTVEDKKEEVAAEDEAL